MPRTQREPGGDLPGMPEPELKWHVKWIPPASVVAEFVGDLSSLAFQIPGTVNEVVMGVSDHITGRDREAGG